MSVRALEAQAAKLGLTSMPTRSPTRAAAVESDASSPTRAAAAVESDASFARLQGEQHGHELSEEHGHELSEAAETFAKTHGLRGVKVKQELHELIEDTKGHDDHGHGDHGGHGHGSRRGF